MQEPAAGTLGQLVDYRMTAHGWCRKCKRAAVIDLSALVARVGREWRYVRRRWPIKCKDCGGDLAVVLAGDTRVHGIK